MNAYLTIFVGIVLFLWIAQGFVWLSRAYKLFCNGPLVLNFLFPPNLSFLLIAGWLFTQFGGLLHDSPAQQLTWLYLGVVTLTGLLGLALLLVFLDELYDFLPFRNSEPRNSSISIAGLDGQQTRELVIQALERLGVETARFGLHALRDKLSKETFREISEAKIFSGPGVAPVALPGLDAVITFSSDRGRTKMSFWEQQTYRKLSFKQLLPKLRSSLATATKTVEPDPTFTGRAAFFFGLRGTLQILVSCGVIAGFFWWFR